MESSLLKMGISSFVAKCKLKGETMGTVYKETYTKPLPAGAKIIVRVPDPDAVPPEPTPENLARPTLAKTRAKRKPN
jgi:hypothetical protein